VKVLVAKALMVIGVGALTALAPLNSQARDVLPEQPGMANETPKALEDVGIEEHLGDQVDLDLVFKDEQGQPVTLREYVKDGKPLLLSLAYYACPNLCNFHLNGLNQTFKKLKEPLGQDFNFVVVSIDPRETSDLAAKKKESYLRAYGRSEGNAGWHFLVGDEANIHPLAKAVGFKYHWDESEQQWAHTSAAYVITPQGKISRYLYGIDFSPQTLRLSLVEASGGKVGSLTDRLILYCFHFDPKANKYTLVAMNAMRFGGGFAVLVMAAFLIPFWLRSRRDELSVQGEV
jgi:protein SCO1/2